MIQTLELLKAEGCNIDGAIERFVYDENFMLDCIEKVLAEPAFERLGEQLKVGDVDEAFETAHMLKGIIANTGLTPLYSIIIKIVEPLRKSDISNLTDYYKELMKEQKRISELIHRATNE